jgi:hypothetical protein
MICLNMALSAGVDNLALADRDGAGGLIAMARGDDPRRIRDKPAVVKEDVDVVPSRQQRADVALKHEVRSTKYGCVVRLIVSDTSGSAACNSSRTWRQMACCQLGRA